ncbi:hypothetical protein MMC07_002307 [Pseudocyphellaria aurata]|nr:hypothetical protein [Pseudocyphellaria aurata]
MNYTAKRGTERIALLPLRRAEQKTVRKMERAKLKLRKRTKATTTAESDGTRTQDEGEDDFTGFGDDIRISVDDVNTSTSTAHNESVAEVDAAPAGPPDSPIFTTPLKSVAEAGGSSAPIPDWVSILGRIAKVAEHVSSRTSLPRGTLTARAACPRLCMRCVVHGGTYVPGGGVGPERDHICKWRPTKSKCDHCSDQGGKCIKMPQALWEAGRILLADITAFYALADWQRTKKVKKDLMAPGRAIVTAKRLGDKSGFTETERRLQNIEHLLLVLVQMQGRSYGVPGDELDRILRASRGEAPTEGEGDDEDVFEDAEE